MSRRVLRWVALCLPLLALAAGIVRGERLLRSGSEWRLDITAYDPRDPLRGRYLQFTVVERWGEALEPGPPEQLPCACLERASMADSATLRAASCERAKEQCGAFVRRDALQNLNRLYVPETRAAALEERLRTATSVGRGHAQILVVVDDEGRIAAVDLLVDGESMLEE